MRQRRETTRETALQREIVHSIHHDRWTLWLRICTFVVPFLALVSFGSWYEYQTRTDQAGRPEQHAIGVVERTVHLVGKLGDSWRVTVRLPGGHRALGIAWDYGWFRVGDKVNVRYVVGRSGQYYTIRITPLNVAH